jgi:hypothetical protein
MRNFLFKAYLPLATFMFLIAIAYFARAICNDERREIRECESHQRYLEAVELQAEWFRLDIAKQKREATGAEEVKESETTKQ